MKIFSKIKNNSAVTLTDVVIALAVLIITTGVLTTSFYTIYKHNVSIRMDAEVLNYTVRILEGIDEMTYEEVTESLDLNNTFDIPEEYQLTLEVEDYNEEDLIKIITLRVEYEAVDEIKSYSVKKLKIKEI